MKKIIYTFFSAVLLTSCTANQNLYSWSNYEDASYTHLKNSTDESARELIKNYQKIIEKQKGTRQSVPPGIYADYGFILLQMNKTEEGKTMLQKEIESYPESKIFIDRILNMLEQ